MRSERWRLYWWGRDELWRDLNNKWALFNQTRESWKRVVLREVVGHCGSHKDLGHMNYTLLGPLSLIKAPDELFCGGPLRKCAQRCFGSTSAREQKDVAMPPCTHTYENRRGNTWEESVICLRGDIKPSYITQLMKPLMIQILCLHNRGEGIHIYPPRSTSGRPRRDRTRRSGVKRRGEAGRRERVGNVLFLRSPLRNRGLKIPPLSSVGGLPPKNHSTVQRQCVGSLTETESRW